MYLPLTGYTKNNKRGAKMKVGSVASQIVTPSRPGQGVQTQNQEVNNQQNNRQPVQQEQESVTSEKYSCQNSKSGMSTEDFLQLHNSSAEDMLDAVKDVMALKVMEKTLEVIDKIVSD
jgi:molecular chaperone GrpE (heat shock protein)